MALRLCGASMRPWLAVPSVYICDTGNRIEHIPTHLAESHIQPPSLGRSPNSIRLSKVEWHYGGDATDMAPRPFACLRQERPSTTRARAVGAGHRTSTLAQSR